MKVNITAALMSKINVLSSEYTIEVGGYLTGKVKDGEVWLDDLLIPDQRITSTSVEINTSDQVALFRKYGARCKSIIGHWHSHHRLGCFWSGTDLNNMKNIMGYKDLFVFIVSSLGNHKVKVCMKNPLRAEWDDCNLYLRTVMIDQLRMRMSQLMGNDTLTSYQKNISDIRKDSIEDKMKRLSQVEEIEEENIEEEGQENIDDDYNEEVNTPDYEDEDIIRGSYYD